LTFDEYQMSTISILNQIIDDEEGAYRIRFGERIGYLTISTDVFDEDTMCRPHLLIPKLPEFPKDGWTRIKITRPSADSPLEIIATNHPLPEIETVWHPDMIDVPSLEQTKRHRSNVHEVLYAGIPAISKIAAFDWEIPRLERETWAYSILDQHQRPGFGELKITPRVLGHLTEYERVMGILLERLDGEFASADDLPGCSNALRRLHEIGMVHGDVNRYNFIVDKKRRQVSMVDFEHAAALDEVTAKKELQSLVSELKEDTGRGGPARLLIS
jgi:predicted Ser/Thr protein kinase